MHFFLFSLTHFSHMSEPVCPIFPMYQRMHFFLCSLTHFSHISDFIGPIYPIYQRMHFFLFSLTHFSHISEPVCPTYPRYQRMHFCFARKQKKARASKGGSALAVAEAPIETFNPMKIPINSVRVGTMDGTVFCSPDFFVLSVSS